MNAAWAFPTGRWCSRRAAWDSPTPRRTASRCGCRARTATRRSPPVPTTNRSRGAPRGDPLPQREEIGVRSHAERQRPGRGAHLGGDRGELPAEGRQRSDTGSVAAVSERGGNPAAEVRSVSGRRLGELSGCRRSTGSHERECPVRVDRYFQVAGAGIQDDVGSFLSDTVHRAVPVVPETVVIGSGIDVVRLGQGLRIRGVSLDRIDEDGTFGLVGVGARAAARIVGGRGADRRRISLVRGVCRVRRSWPSYS